MGETHTLLLLLLLLPAPVCVEATGLRPKFTMVRINARWTDAQAYCRQHFTDLVIIRNEEENLEVFYSWGWIGLYKEEPTSEWKWSRGGETANFTAWKPGEPRIGGSCAFKNYRDKRWMTYQCYRHKYFMCYDERLVLVREEKTWEEALQHCRALEPVDPSKPPTAYLNHRYDLASLWTPDDHDYAREKAQEASTDEVWTGLRFLAGRWVWVGGDGVQYQTLPGCAAQQHCGTLGKNTTRAWEPKDCTERRNFLCYKKP
ncbi:putative C-type lectin domain family 20 member A [Centroberyx affinis]|uniref:putative C-type lectin domain family 20 member A n=1 Tax=Centroberyx affinis TaxID=166261 RepID=UPI003A5BDC32